MRSIHVIENWIPCMYMEHFLPMWPCYVNLEQPTGICSVRTYLHRFNFCFCGRVFWLWTYYTSTFESKFSKAIGKWSGKIMSRPRRLTSAVNCKYHDHVRKNRRWSRCRVLHSSLLLRPTRALPSHPRQYAFVARIQYVVMSQDRRHFC